MCYEGIIEHEICCSFAPALACEWIDGQGLMPCRNAKCHNCD